MKKTRGRQLVVVLMTLAMPLFLLPGTANATKAITTETEAETLTFVHTNDVHGNLEIEPYVKSVANFYKGKNGTKNVITASAGDVFGGGQAIAHLTKGEAVRDVMNAAGYDVVTLGNSDVLAQCGQIINFSNSYGQGTNFRLLCGNLFIAGYLGDVVDPAIENSYTKGDQPFPSYEIFETENGKRVGFFGITSYMEDLAYYTTEGTISAAGKCVEALKAENVDIIVGLLHTGWVDDLVSASSNDVNSYQVAMAVDGIDLIIDGHSHSIINNGTGYTCDNEAETLIVQADCKGGGIGVVNLDLDVDGNILNKSASLLKKADYDTYGADPEVQSIVDEWKGKFEAEYSEVVGYTKYFLNGERANGSEDGLGIRLVEQNLGNLITDAFRYGIENMSNVKDADVVFFNAAMIRASINAGDITRLDLMNVFANGGTICIQEMTGAEIRDMLADSVASACKGVESASFVQVSGLSFTYDDDGTIGLVVMSDGKKLDETSVYRVAYPPRLIPEGSEIVYDGYFELADALQAYLNSDSCRIENYAGPEGRIIKRTNLYGLFYMANDGDEGSLPTDTFGDFSLDKDSNNEVKMTVSDTHPTRAGYSFLGWNDNEAGIGTSYNAGDEITLTKSSKTLTLYAQWGKIPVITGLPETGTIRVGDKFTLIPDPDKQSGKDGWEWEKEYLSATFNSPATFTALKEGNTTITYTDKNGVSVNMKIEILPARESESETDHNNATDTTVETNGESNTDTKAKAAGNSNPDKTGKGQTSAKSVRTGDTTLLGLWTVLLLGSLGGIIILILYRKKKSR